MGLQLSDGAKHQGIRFWTILIFLLGGWMMSAQSSSLNFDGNNDFVNINTGSQVIHAPFTVEAWVKPNSTTGTMNILSTRLPSEFGFDMKLSNGNKIYADIGNGSSWQTYFTPFADYSYAAGEWLHVACVVTTTSYRIYANGNQVATGSVNGNALLIDGTHHINIGSFNNNEFFNGNIDDLKIWNTARTQQQIQDGMMCETVSAVPALAAYYNFNDGIPNVDNTFITSIAEFSGGNVGTLNNFALNGASSNFSNPVSPPTGVVAIGPLIAVSATTTFTAKSTFAGSTPSYQWQLNDADIVGETSAELTGSYATGDEIKCNIAYNFPCGALQTATSNIITIIPAVIYVKADATGNNDGSNWESAYTQLYTAIAQAIAGQQIWVAEGTYKPISGQHFSMKPDVKILGGFEGVETTLEDRDWKLYPTILQKNGGQYLIFNFFNGLKRTAVLDGFKLEGSGNDVTMYNRDVSPTIRNCTFSNSNATAMYNEFLEDIWIENCIFSGNSSPYTYGGAVWNHNVTAYFVNCLFTGNTAGVGGAMANVGIVCVINCTFSGNTSTLPEGHGCTIYNSSTSYIQNCIIAGNADKSILDDGTYSDVRNCLIDDSSYDNHTWSGTNIQGDPYFVDAPSYTTAPFTGGDYRLNPCSPAINKAGQVSLFGYDTPVYDLDGQLRNQLGNIDLGAYETSNNDCTVIWTGTEWKYGLPSANVSAGIEGELNVGTDYPDFTIKNLTVASEGKIIIEPGHSVTVSNQITNNATIEDFTIESGGSLLQTNNVQNTGSITVRRNSFPLYRQDYTLWGSPVAQQNLRSFSPQTLFNRFYSYDTAAGTVGEYVQEIFTTQDMQDKLFNPAEGYMVRMPNDWPVYVNNTIAGASYQGKFEGVPNNGNIAIPLSTANTAVNLVANPYPSPISITALLNANPGIERTVYFWRKRNGVAGSGYASYNAFGLASPQPEINGLDLQDAIAVGQGFFVKSTGATTLNFNNQMRSASAGNMMMRSAQEEERHRIWLDLSNSIDVIGQALLGYATGATEGADNGLDGAYFNDSPAALTSLIGNAEYAIQARPVPFDVADEVPLGFKTNAAGTYAISLSNTDGLFSDTQDIFLKDSQNSQLHDLRQSAYSFTTNEGTFNNRFSVVYQSTLDTKNPELDANNIAVYRKDRQLHVNAGTIVMQKIELFDIRGRLIHTLDEIDSTTARIQQLDIANQVLIMKITSVENKTIIKKVIY